MTDNTAWIAPAIAAIREQFAPGDALVLAADLPPELGSTPEVQEARLRDLTRRGMLIMDSHFKGGRFSHYLWILKAGA